MGDRLQSAPGNLESVLGGGSSAWREIVSSLPVVVTIHDVAGNVLYINYSPTRSVEEVVGRNVLEFVHPSDASVVKDAMEKAARTRERVSYETRALVPGGGFRWYSVQMAPLVRASTVAALLAVSFDVTRRKELAEARERLEAERDALTRRVLEAEEKERARVAQELHDDLGQILTVLRLELGRLMAYDPSGVAELITEAHALVVEAGRRVRDLAHRLRPLDDSGEGLAGALETLAAEIADSAGIRVEADVRRADPLPADPAAATVVYRIAQEALTNVVRHAECRRASIRLRERDGVVEIEIADDGAGTIEGRGGFGITGMRSRAASLGGELSVRGEPGKGTVVIARVPWGKGGGETIP